MTDAITKTNSITYNNEDNATDLSQYRFPAGDTIAPHIDNGSAMWDDNGDLWTKSDAGWKPVSEVSALIMATDTFPSIFYNNIQSYGVVEYSHNIPYTRIPTPADATGDTKWGAEPKIPAEIGIFLVNASFTYQSGTWDTASPLTLTLAVTTGGAPRTAITNGTPDPTVTGSAYTLAGSLLYRNTAATARDIAITLAQTPTSNNCICRVSIVKLSEIDSNPINNIA